MKNRNAAPIAILALLVMAATPVRSQAQKPALERGSLLIGGNASFTIQSVDYVGQDYESDNTTSVGLAPNLLYFVAPGLALGGEAQFSRSSHGDNSITSYGIGPALAYYFVQESAVQPFVRASVRLSRSTHSMDTFDSTTKFFGFRGAGGILVLLSDAVGLDAAAYFDRLQQRDGGDVNINTFGLSVGVSAFVF